MLQEKTTISALQLWNLLCLPLALEHSPVVFVISLFFTKRDDALLIPVTSVLSILSTTLPVPRPTITQVAEHVTAQANVL